jgi:hypothetical protein
LLQTCRPFGACDLSKSIFCYKHVAPLGIAILLNPFCYEHVAPLGLATFLNPFFVTNMSPGWGFATGAAGNNGTARLFYDIVYTY